MFSSAPKPTRRRRASTGPAVLLAAVDEAHALRESDPAQALARIEALRPRWVALAPAQRSLLEARAGAVAANAHFWRGEYAAAEAAVERLFAHVDDPSLSDASASWVREARRALRSGHNLRAMLASRRGDDPAALRDFTAALALTREQGDRRGEARALVNLANVYGHIGLEQRAIELHTQALGLAQALPWPELVVDIHHNIGAALAGCGELEAAVAAHRLALAEIEARGLQRKKIYPLGAIGEHLLQLGLLDEAAQTLRDTDALIREETEPAVVLHAAHLHVELALRRNELAHARAAALHCLNLAHTHGLRHFEGRAHLDLGRMAFDSRQFDDALAHAGQALAVFESGGLRQETSETLALLSHIAEASGDAATALVHLRRFHALDRVLRADRSALQTKVLMVEYEVERERAETERHRLENQRLTEALAEIGANLRDAAAADDGSAPPRRAPLAEAKPRDLMALGLTAREAEVLFWVTRGKTNADVAQILSTGMSAVKKHLSRVFEKLDVENRTAASDVARRRTAR